MPATPSGLTRTRPRPARERFRLPLDIVRRGTIPQLPALDGMRGMAVLLVIVYHLGSTSVPGGFLGVDVFFVVSGYLITSLLLAELRDNNWLDLAGFWARRIRRLVPALLLFLGTLAVTVPFLASDAAGRLRGDLPASLLYLSNWWQIVADRSYFEAFGRPDLLRHLWSLAIEEQFYLLWPPVLAALYTRLHNRRWLIPCLTASGALISVLLMLKLYDPSGDPSRVYYGTDTRAFALLIGATLAFLWNPDIARRAVNLPPVLIDLAAALGVAIVTIGVTRWNGYDPRVYRGGFLLIALATALVIVAAATNHTLVGAVLRAPVLRWLGERSYGLYLWHWPIIQMTRPRIDVPAQGAGLLVLRAILIAGAAECSWRLVERPLRRPRASSRGPASHRYRRASVVVSLALPLLLVPFLANGSTASTSADIALTAGPTTTGVGGDLVTSPPSPVAANGAPTATRHQSASTTPPSTEQVATTGGQPATTAVAPPEDAGPTSTSQPPVAVLGAAETRSPDRGSNVLLIGDSVMLGARREVLARYPAADLDAVVSRQLRDAPELARTMRATARVRPIVVVHLGNNGSATKDQLESFVDELSGAQRIIFLTTSAPRPWRDAVNDRLAELARDNDKVDLVDWRDVTREVSGVLVDDGVHLTPAGAARYAAAIESVIG